MKKTLLLTAAFLAAALAFTGCPTDPADETTKPPEPEPKAAAPQISAFPESADYRIIEYKTDHTTNVAPAVKPLSITAAVSDGGTLSYQWYINNRAGVEGAEAISGATGATYTPPTTDPITGWYYCVVTNTVTGIEEKAKVTSNIVKVGVTYKNYTLLPIIGGQVTSNPDDGSFKNGDVDASAAAPITVPGFNIGETEMTWVLWDEVKTWATANGYTNLAGSRCNDGYKDLFGDENNWMQVVKNTNFNSIIVWCNAFSEMTGKDPVYLNSSGDILKDGGSDIWASIDQTKMAGKNGYRLPSIMEWEYAARGGNPADAAIWNLHYAGVDAIDDDTENNITGNGDYTWAGKGKDQDKPHYVKQKLPNAANLYDMSGNQWEHVFAIDNNDKAVIKGGAWGYCPWIKDQGDKGQGQSWDWDNNFRPVLPR
jgi:formylglycine-generating enzyme required for sulfatase activity